ncbi:testis-specific serine/threonine-protein kinase 1-like [Liolophura sinensis]|uniref:testis-specific serine/threonine-protein kinase 1-like n=1 Tax=Liolophura sinensis TaxID=3198878 RepID=UPI0031584A23
MSNSGRKAQSLETLVSRFSAKKKREQDITFWSGESEGFLSTDRTYSLTPRQVSNELGESQVPRVPAREKDVLSAHGYFFQSIISESKCSKLYNVTDRRNGKLKAVRVYTIENAALASPHFVNFIKNEITTLSQIQHENIIRLYYNFQYYSRHYVIMDYMENGSLENYMKAHRLFPSPKERKSIFQQMLSACKYCHDINIVHHDLKLTNILLDKNNDIKLYGFGWCVPWASEQGEVELCTDYCGNLDYAAPEVLTHTPYDPRPVDIWALGVILYTLLCFELPFGSVSSSTRRLFKYQKSRKLRKRIVKKAPPEEQSCIHLILDMLEPDVTQRISLNSIFSCKWLSEERKSKAENAKSTPFESSPSSLSGIFTE